MSRIALPFVVGVCCALTATGWVAAEWPEEVAREIGVIASVRVTDADVAAYLDKQSGAAAGRSWRWYMDMQRPNEKTVFAGWPELVADPTMWSWYEHAVVRGEHEEWYWARADESIASAPYLIDVGVGTAYAPICSIPITGTTVSGQAIVR